ncbi:MAG: selenocysteine-specific translation elongation factor [Anaerolineae bacterium]
MYVIGTAGHVDHGKSTLVRALTGIDPDRLREEQERQMTIDLGFAWLTLPSGREVSVVDVPGHEDFIKNMLAGVGGIDVALFVVAADESVMPQTREHLAILDLLQIPQGVVALTKSELIDDPEWLDLVREEVREQLVGTVLAKAAIIPVSSVTGAGLPELARELDRLLDAAEPRRDVGRPRLPIDRVFSIAGFGTVVTGTLIDGRLVVGQEVEIVPGGLTARVRGLQSHKVKVQDAEPGSRVAANLSGVTVDELQRGQVVTKPGWLRPTELVDARLRLVSQGNWTLRHNALVDFYSGAARAEAYVRLLDADVLEPGQEGWVQLRLSEPVALARGDRYILRLPSPSMTIGGGQLVQPNPGRRHRRFRPEVLARLESLARGTPEDVLLNVLGRQPALEARQAIERANLPEEEAAHALVGLMESGLVLALSETPPTEAALVRSGTGVLLQDSWERLRGQMVATLESYHQRNPLRGGMPREELKSRIRLDGSLFNQAVERAAREGTLAASQALVRLASYAPQVTPEQRRQIDRLLAEFRANPFAPPSLQQAEETLGSDLLQFLLQEGRLVKVSDAVLLDAETYAEMERRVVAYLKEHETITVAEVRDLFSTSRKYALGLLEDLDSRRVTKRVGDARVLR